MLRIDFAVGFHLPLGFFQRLELGFGQDLLLLRHFGFQSFEMFLKSFQIVVQPHAQHPTQQDE